MGALIGAGALKGTNTVYDIEMANTVDTVEMTNVLSGSTVFAYSAIGWLVG